MNATPILASMIRHYTLAAEAVVTFDYQTGDPSDWRFICRDFSDAEHDLAAEIYWSHGGAVVIGGLTMVALNDGELRITDGPWKRSWKAEPCRN